MSRRWSTRSTWSSATTAASTSRARTPTPSLAILPKTRKPAPVASHLRKTFPERKLPARHAGRLQPGRLPEAGDHPPLDVPSPQGLKVVLDVHGKPRHSVRGIVVHRQHLYVAGEAGNAVKVFELKTGRFVARIKGKKLAKPVHLILHGDTLYIGAAGTGSILAYDIPKEAPRGKLKPRTVIDGKLKAPSGFAIGPDGDLYVAERFDQRVRRFSIKGKSKGTFIEGLPDMPEFLVHVPDPAVRPIRTIEVRRRGAAMSIVRHLSFEEALWGGVLVAITMAIHGTGMFAILRIIDALKERFAPMESFVGGLGLVILASLLIVVTNVVEVIVWAVFFLVQGAQPTHSVAMYNALLNYTTLQAGYLPQHWHLLEALLGMAGLLTVAWSTGILYMLAQDFQDTQLRKRRRKREEQVGTTRKSERDSSADRGSA